MPDFPQALPKTNKFHCSAERHLWRQGLCLAIYNKVGAITAIKGGGHNLYFADTAQMAHFLNANKAHVRESFAKLHRAGWLVVVENNPQDRKFFKKIHAKKKRRWVSHEEWAKAHPGQCICVDETLMPWSAEADPLCGQLHAAFDGQLKIKGEGYLTFARACGASDSEIVASCRTNWETAKEKLALAREHRRAGNHQSAEKLYKRTNPASVFFDTCKALAAARATVGGAGSGQQTKAA